MNFSRSLCATLLVFILSSAGCSAATPQSKQGAHLASEDSGESSEDSGESSVDTGKSSEDSGKSVVVPPTTAWTATWSAAMQKPLALPELILAQTVRQVVHVSLGGSLVRVRFSNAFGTEPLTLDEASVGLRDDGANVLEDSLRTLTFNGARSVTIDPGQEALSDAVQLDVNDEADLAISTYHAGGALGTTTLSFAHQTSYVSWPGNYASKSAFLTMRMISSWLWLTDVEVERAGAGTVVAFGDSITEGMGSTTDLNARWPDVLARRLVNCGAELAVVDVGISGNRVLNENIGPSAEARLERDLFGRANVRYAVLLEGINDIGFATLDGSLLGQVLPGTFNGPNVSANDIIAGYTRIIERAHAAGITIYGGTLAPIGGAFYSDDAGESKRQLVNDWIRTAKVFDGFIDFDVALRDPAYPDQLLRAFNSGDSIHPSDEGYAAMGEAIDLELFGSQACN